MAMKQLNLEEQEQLDKIKAFWQQYGNWISAFLVVVLGAFAAYYGHQWWQRDKAAQASAMFEEVERVSKEGDAAKINRAFTDMKERFGSTTFAAQAGLLAAKSLYDQGNVDAAKEPLQWVADNAVDDSYKAIAKLRLSALLVDDKKYDEALKLTEGLPGAFAALAADRRGDILLAQGKRQEAQDEFLKAYKGMEERAQYKVLLQVKLTALGVDVNAVTSTAAATATGTATAGSEASAAK